LDTALSAKKELLNIFYIFRSFLMAGFLPNFNLGSLNPFNSGNKGYSAGQVSTGAKEYVANKLPDFGGGGNQVLGASTTRNPYPGNAGVVGDTPPNLGGGVVGGNGNGASAADLAYLDTQENQLRDMLNRSQGTLNQGLTRLSDSYNSQVGSANRDRSRFLEDLQTRQTKTDTEKQSAIGKVDTNARTLNDSLRRMIGMASGSESSAYKLAAPNAVARQASGERTDVLSDYADNMGTLDTTRRRGTEDYDRMLGDLGTQRNQKEAELREGIYANEQGINSSLADISGKRAMARGAGYQGILAAQQPYQTAITERQNAIDSLFERFRNPVLSAAPVNVQAPDLKQYTVDRAALGQNRQSGSPYEPYYSPLRRQLEEELA
jgi:hypothetical protein